MISHTHTSPTLPASENKKFTLLSIIFFIIIGTYWLLRILKNTIFFKIAFPEELGWFAHQGRLFQPTAKLWSTVVVLCVVLLYSKLIDVFKKQQLFYAICGFYALLFAGITALLYCTEIYGPQSVGKTLLACTGWATYFAVESFGSLIVALFWSFATSSTTTEHAKKGFPRIIVAAQAGAIIGSCSMLSSSSLGCLWPLFLCATLLVLSIIPFIIFFIRAVPEHLHTERQESFIKKEGFFAGFVNGLYLLFSRSYLRGVLVISTLYEIAGQVVDYQLQTQAAIAPQFASAVAFGKLMGFFGLAVNTLSFVIAYSGTQKLLLRAGVRTTLLIYPLCFLGSLAVMLISCIVLTPLHPYLLWITFILMMIVKALNYAVNTPTREMLYIPTSYDIMFKTKGWIDMFGERLAETTGARISASLKDNITELMVYGTLINCGIVGIWLIAVVIVGTQHQQLIEKHTVIT